MSDLKDAKLRMEHARKRFVEKQQADHKPGYCPYCETQKTIADFPPRQKGQPVWRLHDYKCKECNCKQVGHIHKIQRHQRLGDRTTESLRWRHLRVSAELRELNHELKRRACDGDNLAAAIIFNGERMPVV